MIVEIIGYIASLLLLSYPTALTNLILVAINIYHLVRLRKKNET